MTQAQGGGERRACPLSLLVALQPRRSVTVSAQRARRWSDDRCPGAWPNNSVARGTFCPRENPARTCCHLPLAWHARGAAEGRRFLGRLLPRRACRRFPWQWYCSRSTYLSASLGHRSDASENRHSAPQPTASHGAVRVSAHRLFLETSPPDRGLVHRFRRLTQIQRGKKRSPVCSSPAPLASHL